MYRKILVPVDLTHARELVRALEVAADLSRHYGAPIVYVAVTAETPTPVAHNPTEFARKLEEFGKAQAQAHAITAETRAYTSTDPAIDVDSILRRAVSENGADLVVMQSHVPNVTDYLWGSHGGSMASHADVSVLVVR